MWEQVRAVPLSSVVSLSGVLSSLSAASACLQELECIPEALDLSKSFKHVQGRELDLMILVGPLQLRRL